MSTRLSGIRFLALGETWRNAFISGKTIKNIAAEVKQNPQTVSRAIWLARIPNEIKQLILSQPEIFTRKILLDTFAAKRKQCEKDGFKKLQSEVVKMLQLGKGSKPALKLTNNKVLRKKPKLVKPDPTLHLCEAMTAENLLKKKLKLHCRVAFNKNKQGEIRIFFSNSQELEEFLAHFM